MDRELARKRPPAVITPSPTRSQVVGARGTMVLRNAQRAALMAEVTRMHRAGQIQREFKTMRLSTGIWVAEVVIRKHPRWLLRLPLVAVSVLAFLGIAYVVVRLLVEALAALLPYAVGGLVILALAAVLGGRQAITVIQSVTIK